MTEDADSIVQETQGPLQPTREQEGDVATSIKGDVKEAGSPVLLTKIEGGFAGLTADLDRRSRDWTMMVRLVEQQRLQLETAENERARLHAELQAILPGVLESSHSLDDAIATTKKGDISSNLSALFAANLAELDQLENVAKALTANLLFSRSCWEQYARSILGAQKMRESVKD